MSRSVPSWCCCMTSATFRWICFGLPWRWSGSSSRCVFLSWLVVTVLWAIYLIHSLSLSLIGFCFFFSADGILCRTHSQLGLLAILDTITGVKINCFWCTKELFLPMPWITVRVRGRREYGTRFLRRCSRSPVGAPCGMVLPDTAQGIPTIHGWC